MKYVHKQIVTIVTINLMVPLMNRWKIALHLISDLLPNEHARTEEQRCLEPIILLTTEKRTNRWLLTSPKIYNNNMCIQLFGGDDGGSDGSMVFSHLFW